MQILVKKKYLTKITWLALAVFLIMPALINPASAQDDLEILNIQTEDIDSQTVKIKWQTNVETRGKIIYGQSSANLNSYLIDSKGLAKYHEMLIGNLAPETIYYFQIVVTRESDQIYSFIHHFETAENEAADPLVSNVQIPYVSGTAAVITWQTNKESTSVVEFDKYQTYEKSVSNRSKTTDHLIILKDLYPDARYYFRVYSTDKDKNQSSFFHEEFMTLDSDASDREDLIISLLRPNSPDDQNISDQSMTVSFKTNHYAQGKVKLMASGHGSQTKNLAYGLSHLTSFSGLASDSEYVLSISMTDIFDKEAEIKDFPVKTAETPSAGDDSVKVLAAVYSGFSCSEALGLSGYYGYYFNLPKDTTPNIKKHKINLVAEETGWYDEKYLSFSRIDQDLDFGSKFFPLDEGLAGDPYYFAVYWRAVLEADSDGHYQYEVKSDDDAWVFVDGELTTNLGGRHRVKGDSRALNLSKGLHSLDIYFAERKVAESYFSFLPDDNLKVHPWPADCSLTDIAETEEEVIVKGVEFSYYTPASALYKTSDSPDIYAIVNNQRHYISSPASFMEYGYNWTDVRTVSQLELFQYPRARLIKGPERQIIYYLYQRPEDKWLKIAIPSPTAFVSYPDNHWGNVITVNQYDLDSYPDVKLIKAEGNEDVYYLENNIKHFISEEVFRARGLSEPEIVEVSRTHLETHQTGLALAKHLSM